MTAIVQHAPTISNRPSMTSHSGRFVRRADELLFPPLCCAVLFGPSAATDEKSNQTLREARS
jgi:hypothetical protein